MDSLYLTFKAKCDFIYDVPLIGIAEGETASERWRSRSHRGARKRLQSG